MFGRTKKGATESTSSAVAANNVDVERQLKADRTFWEYAVLYMLNEDDTADMAVKRAVEVADKLLMLRRERFPVQD